MTTLLPTRGGTPCDHVARRVARSIGGFESSREALLDHVRQTTGVELDAGLVHVDAATGSILKTFSTESSVELVLLGQALPTLGVPVNAHLHANGAAGIGAGRS
jgi:hypothetical protein